MKRTTKIKLWIAAGLLMLGVITAIPTGRWIGDRLAKASYARLSLIWPDVRALPLPERHLLALLSLQCRLHREPFQVNAVIACLRRAARAPTFKLPQGIRNPEHALERLLREVPSDRGTPQPGPESPELNPPAAPGELLGQERARPEKFG